MSKLLIRYGEISLKGKNRERFIDALVFRIKERMAEFESCVVSKRHGRIFLDYKNEDEPRLFARLSKTFGVVSFSPVAEVDLDLEEAALSAVSQMQEAYQEGKRTFKIESRRSNKGFYLTSPELSREVGARVLAAVKGIKVDVHEPDVIINIEVRHKIYVFSKIYPAEGGMPYGTSGRGLVLLSGGIDSPVAAYMMARRGLYIEALHFHSYPYTSERAMDKVRMLAEKLADYTVTLKLHSVNLAKIQEEIRDKCPSDEMTILSRRFMMRLASKVAALRDLGCLVTGESLAQVASQTLESMRVIEDASDYLIFKPLVAFDKSETTKISKQIDYYQTSILPFEDCCTVFLPDSVVTRPKLDKILKSEKALDVDALVDAALSTLETREIRVLRAEDLAELI